MGVSAPARVAVVGVHGHGSSHLRTVRALAARGRAVLHAVVDPRPVAGTTLAADGPQGPLVPAATPWYADLGALLADSPPDVVVLATPIHTHLDLARSALLAGCDVLLEKPTAASLAEHDALVAAAAAAGRRVQVGFQTFGSGALAELARVVASGELGDVTTVAAVGTWVRTSAYYARSRWAGRRTLDGVPVVDGVVTNPLAHAVASALLVAGATRAADVLEVETDLWRAHPIEADDTSSVVVTLAGGRRVAAGLTLCAPERADATVVVRGTEGSATLRYEHDDLRITSHRGTRSVSATRTDLLENLLAARGDPSARLSCDVADTGAFMAVLDAVRTAPDPRPIAAEHVTWQGDGPDAHPVVHDVVAWCDRVGRESATFTALGAPWTR
ncbi:Gfo/Idh/MocA family oxidoreductase [Cellulomonas sp. zg-ZUI22]|nr:Gfo/Idh/MocA family oxidoreductase [Cellulomonas sp. zg-ZUI22]